MTDRPDLPRKGALVATGLVALPIVVAAVRAAAGRWVPQGDEAYFTLRSMDVATEHHPLLGAWSSGSADIERDVNNLGPFQLDLLAPFTKVAPMGGTAIGVAVIHLVAIATIAWLVRRVGGFRAVPPAMIAVGLLVWVLGSEMVITPRQHQFLVLPYLVVLVAAWAATAGDRWAPVAFVVAASLVTQTHLSYPILVAALVTPVVAGQILGARRAGGTGTYRRPWVVAGLTSAVLWAQTLVDQLFGRGNLGDVLRSPGETVSPGLADGVRIVADVILDPGTLLRPGYAAYDPNSGLASGMQVAAFAIAGLLVVTAAVAAARSRRPTLAAGLVVSLVAALAGIVDASRLPVTQFGLTAGNYRWLWPTTAFLLLGGLVAFERVARTVDGRVRTLIALGVIALLAALAVPTSYQVPDADRYREHLDATAALTTQLASADLSGVEGPVVIDQSRMFFGHPFAYPVAVVLLERGVEFRFEGAQQARRFGDDRASDGSERSRLVLVHADEARDARDDDSAIAFVDGPDPVALVLTTTP